MKGYLRIGEWWTRGESIFLKVVVLLAAAWCTQPTLAVNVLTQHNDNFRTGANLSEFVLTTSNVNTGQFGKLFTRIVDGQMYAQPLYVHALTISNKTRNVVYVCTETNSVYAFDADDAGVSNALWHVNLGPPVPSSDLNNCGDLSPRVGITGTPVIDLTNGTLYVEAKTKESGNYFHRLHALDLITGQEEFGGPVLIQGSVPGTGDGSNTVSFGALHVFNRPGLLLLSNVVYIGFGSHCDWAPYRGWLIGYNATNLQQVSIFSTTPNGSEAAIWSCGMGPAADSDGNIYVMTGNGSFDKNTGGPDLGDSFVKLTPSNGVLAVTDWFTPHDQATLSANDQDIGTGGPVLMPSTNVFVGLGKTGAMYVLDRNHLGGFVPNVDTNTVQVFQPVPGTCCIGQCPVYWNGPTNQFLFLWTGSDVLKALKFNGFTFQTTPLAQSSVTQSRPGGTSLSANGNAAGSGIVWGMESGSGGTAHAYDATNVAHELWNSQQNAARDALGNYVKFCSPTIANGKLYAATGASKLVVYGLLSAPYQIWQSQHFTTSELTNSAISGDLADPDGDGLPNLEEYAFNTDPKTTTTSGLPIVNVVNVGGVDYLAISYQQVLFNTDITCIVQVSDDLATWNSGPGFTVLVSDVENGDGTETLLVRDATPISSAAKRFIRVHVSRP